MATKKWTENWTEKCYKHMLELLILGGISVSNFKKGPKNGPEKMNAIESPPRDTAGQERYHSVTPMYYRGAQAALVVYDITNADTFARAKDWVKELQRQARPDVVIALAGNKSDLGQMRAVEYEEANTYAEENGLLFLETSAKNANNVNEIFLAIARKMPRDRDGGSTRQDGIRPGQSGEGQVSKGSKLSTCCK